MVVSQQSNAGRYSSFIDLKLFIEFLRAGGANVDRDLVSLRKLRETPQYHDAMGRFPVLLAEYFPKLHVETIIRLSDSNPPTSRAKCACALFCAALVCVCVDLPCRDLVAAQLSGTKCTRT